MRLTNTDYLTDVLHLKNHKTQWGYNNDLWQYAKEREDIEEELDIDLVTFFKIRKHCYDRNPIFIKERDEIIESDCRVELCYESVAVHTGDYGAYTYSLKDYGKTWALTKEELL